MLRDLEYLRSIQEIPKDQFLGNVGTLLATRYALLEPIQIVIDLAFHLCAQNKLHEPDNYREAFKILTQNNFLSPELAGTLADWAGLRNLLAHQYLEVNDERLYEFIHGELSAFDQFLEEIEKLEGVE
ncbi:MAG TPA: DUF86 domain-containing protein [Candidatus Lokiarchaeia archaeon]|nr:DUF86 domain-containing protein [Candidatus Lokiarchaeia archaeon]